MKLKIHSAVDLITNSSTVIYTYSEGSLPALKELVNEMLKTFDRTEKFDDIFYAGVFLENDEIYIDAFEESEEVYSYENVDLNYLIKLKEYILMGELEKPKWMIEAEESESYDGYKRETNLEIIPKSEKYKELADLLINYLYSTYHEACYG